jgi:high-affinity nickel-transport protein
MSQLVSTRRPRSPWSALARVERRQLAVMAAAVVALHLVGWGVLLAVVVPGQYGTPAAPVGIGIGVAAYVLGMRHAFDADHIAAIDNVTRRLLVDSRHRPLSVGFFFSLGHSSVVLGLAAFLAFGIRSVVAPLLAEGSWLHSVSSIAGNASSGLFLVAVGIVNIRALVTLRRGGVGDAGQGDAGPASGGAFARWLQRPLGLVSRPRWMYPVGFLFGLGFDTATEIGLLVVAATGAAVGVPWYGVLCLPVLFAAGMVLFDSIDGVFVNFAYGWALADSARKFRYNVVVTSASVGLALGVGGIEIGTALALGLTSRGPLASALDRVDLNLVGVIAVIALALVFLVVLVLRREHGQPPTDPSA